MCLIFFFLIVSVMISEFIFLIICILFFVSVVDDDFDMFFLCMFLIDVCLLSDVLCDGWCVFMYGFFFFFFVLFYVCVG